jgi:hypothetical protein
VNPRFVPLLKKWLPSLLVDMGRAGRNWVRTASTRSIVHDVIIELEAAPGSPFKRTPRVGHLRGIDFYKRPQLMRAMALAMVNYKAKHGTFPNLSDPRSLNEKIIWSKFFTERPVPAGGNKLLTSHFIPIDLQDTICVQE